MTLLFWGAAALIAYVYAGYPAFLYVRSKLRRADDVAPIEPADARPGVSIVIAARNEAHNLRGRIENLLQLQYPVDRRQIIVVSDGSTDGTDAAIAPYLDVVDFLAVPSGGKALALNAGVAKARHDVLVFTDARQPFAPDALVELTRPLADPAVGGVTGELLLDCESNWRRTRDVDRRARERPGSPERRRTLTSTIADGIGAYWRYEKTLRRLESANGSTVGATGAIYAMRRSLWTPLPPDTILDDVLGPMRAVLAGYRFVFNPRARAFDRTAADAGAEWARKVRTLAGNFQILWLEPRLVDPARNPVWWQYVSHKIGRLVVPYALVALVVANIALAGEHVAYRMTLGAQCAAYLLAGYGAWLERRTRVIHA